MYTLIIYKPKGTSRYRYAIWQYKAYLKSTVLLNKDRNLNPPGFEEKLLSTEWIDHLDDVDFDHVIGVCYIHWEE